MNCSNCPPSVDTPVLPQNSIGIEVLIPFYRDITAATNIQVKITPKNGRATQVEFPQVAVGVNDKTVNGVNLLAGTYAVFLTREGDLPAQGHASICTVYFDGLPSRIPSKDKSIYIEPDC